MNIPAAKMKIGRSLSMKAMVILVVVVVFAAALGGAVSNHLLSAWVRQLQNDHANRVAEMLRAAVAGRLAEGNVPAAQQAADGFLRQQDVLAVSIHGADGRRVAHARRRDAAVDLPPCDDAPIELAYIRQAGPKSLWVARPVLAGDDDARQVVGSVRIALDAGAAANQLRRAQITMGVLILAFVLGFIPLGHVLVTRFLIRPIQQLVHAADRLAQGDYAARTEHNAADEIGSLARSFNAMATCIEGQHRQLRTYSEQLEDLVQRRTAALDAANTRLRAEMEDHQQFLRAVSHDLNAPLRNIGGMTAMLMMEFASRLPDEVTDRLKRIQANVDAQTDLINDLLELSRIGTRPSRREWVAMGELLHDVAAGFEFDLCRRAISLHIAPGMPGLFIERNHARQVFGNLIDNAVKYMGARDDGRIEITCECTAESFIFHVADNGIGIAPEDQQRIFVVFRRAAGVPADVPGKGLGLAGVATIAAKYNGRVWVDSEAGQGSVFHVSFARRACLPPATSEDADEDGSTIDQHGVAHHPAG